jgi:hypothetical protein
MNHEVPVTADQLGLVKSGGSQPALVKKTDRKVKVLGRERCIYIDCKRREYIKKAGKYVRLTDARSM